MKRFIAGKQTFACIPYDTSSSPTGVIGLKLILIDLFSFDLAVISKAHTAVM
jgi:hypothetical protein